MFEFPAAEVLPLFVVHHTLHMHWVAADVAVYQVQQYNSSTLSEMPPVRAVSVLVSFRGDAAGLNIHITAAGRTTQGTKSDQLVEAYLLCWCTQLLLPN